MRSDAAASRTLSQQGLHIPQQRGQLHLHGAPYQRMVHQVVAVDQDVSKGDDLRVLRDALGTSRVHLGQPLDRLADDLEVAFHALAQQALGAVLR
jgi:hypothetical protein